jgi:uncharacterized protein (TIGR00725 family)
MRHATPGDSTAVNAGMALKIGVMGGASDVESPDHLERTHQLGQAIAESGCILITGGCGGLPLSTACGAKQAGGLVIGISPGLSLDEHVYKYRSPTEFHDVLVFTGSGLMGREVVNIRTSDIVIIVGGRSGTLGELAISYDEGKLIGVLTGTGGITGLVREILEACAKDTGARVLYDDDPRRLVTDLLRFYREVHHRKPSFFCEERPATEGADEKHTALDPVCGMRLAMAAAARRREIAGETVVFCSRQCEELFDAEPERYARRD